MPIYYSNLRKTMDYHEIHELAKAIVAEMDKRTSGEQAPKWKGGTIKFIPADKSMKENEMPIDRFLSKIIMVRDNLRVLEQQINSDKTLSEGEKIKFQSYITKSYGSLTSFNFLFWFEEDKFKGAGGA
ncbi:MAG: hypothetical protein HYZ54_07465 [Ignavibacteriae bacterium]|nr:hypothetical protein [Ignavibacteriota bacterium]